MSTSPLGYPVTHETGEYAQAKKPLDAFSVRNVLLNNLCHYADEAAQTRVAMVLPSSTVGGGQGYLVPGTSVTAGTFYPICSWQSPICVRASGRSYRMRVRIAGATGGSGTAYFYLRMSPGAAPSLPLTDDATFLASTTGTSAAWLTGTSQGAQAYTTMIELRTDQTAACLQTYSTVSDLSGDAVGLAIPIVTLTVYCAVPSGSSVPRLYGVYAAEYVGP